MLVAPEDRLLREDRLELLRPLVLELELDIFTLFKLKLVKMKQVTRTRVDSFVSSGGYCRVYGRKDHVLSTEVQIKKKFDGVMRKFPAYDDQFDRFFFNAEYRAAHVEPRFDGDDEKDAAGAIIVQQPNDFKFQINDFPINRSIEQCEFHPLTCQNTLDVRPRDQLTLLPYLTEQTIRENHKYRLPQNQTLQWTDGAGEAIVAPNEALPYTYFPTEQSRFFIEIERDGDLKVDDEKEIFGHTIGELSHWNLNVLQDKSIRLVLKASQIVLDGGGAVGAAADQLVGTQGIPMVKRKKLIDGKWYNVYRTQFQNYFFRRQCCTPNRVPE